MKTNHATCGFTAAFLAMSVTTLLCIGCGGDPNGATGGTGGKGGTAVNTGGNGGSPAGNLGAVVGTLVEGFDGDASKVNFQFSNYPDPAELNLSLPPTMAQTTLSWDPNEGSPNPGSLKISAPFSDFNQWVEVQLVPLMPPTHPFLNWTGKKLHVRLKVGAGLGQDPYALSGAQALVDTTTSYVQAHEFKQIQPNNQWQEFTLDLSSYANTPGFDASMVITYGIHITSGSGGSASAVKPIPATL